MNTAERRVFYLFLVLLASIYLLGTVRTTLVSTDEKINVNLEELHKPPMAVQILPLPPSPKPKSKPKMAKQPKPNTSGGKTDQKSGEGQGNSGGGVNIVGEFACDFDFYLSAMQSMGGLLVAYENRSKAFFQVVGDSVLPLERLQGDFSPVARNVTNDHPQAGLLLEAAMQQAGPGSYSLLLFWPRSVQAQVDAAITRQLPEVGKQGKTVFIRYRRSGDTLLFDFYRVNMGGKNIPMDYRMALN